MTRPILRCLFPCWLLVLVPCITAAQPANPLQSYLLSHETTEPLLARSGAAVRQELKSLVPALSSSLRAVDLYVTAFDESLPGVYYPYRTRNCIAALTGLPAPSIICDAEYVAQIEMVVRAFENAGALLQRDANLMGFALASGKDPRRFLRQLRTDPKLARISDQSDEHIGLHLTIALLFIASHEVGHLLDNADFRSYDLQTSGDGRIRAAVVKTCRHAEEFSERGFGLPGLQSIVTPRSESRQVEERYRKEAQDAYDQATKRFAGEDRADKFAVRLILDYLAASDKISRAAGRKRQHLLVETLFVVGVYSWYRDLALFSEKTCGSVGSSDALTACMLRDRQTYVDASAVFGDVHRFVLLRSLIAIGDVLTARLTPQERSSIWPSKAILDNGEPEAVARESDRAGDMQRHTLLRVLMDTPVKFAYAACGTGWFTELDAKRGSPQIFVMTFEKLEQAISRLKQFQ